MKVTYYPNKINKEKSVLILGSFEYIHNGHISLIKEAKKIKRNVSIMIIDDPSKLPKKVTSNITSLKNRLEMVSRLGVNNAYVVKYTKDIANMEGRKFIESIYEISNATQIIMGKDFRAGVGGSYTSDKIAKDFQSRVFNLEKYKNNKISSTLISEFIQLGQVERLKEISIFPWEVYLSFANNKKTKSFPYVNPHPGIYAVGVIVNEIYYWGVFHFSKKKVGTLFVPDLKITNKPFDANVIFHKNVRTIISAKDDDMLKADKQLAAKYLITL